MKLNQRLTLAALAGGLLLGAPLAVQADPALDAYYAANALYNKKLYKLAVEEYEAFLLRYPNHEKKLNAKLGLALAHYDQRAFDKARPILEELADNVYAPHQEQVHNLLGQCYLIANRPADAENAFRWSVNRGKEKSFVELPGVAQSFHEAPALAVGVTDLDPLERSYTGLIEALFQQAKWQEVTQVSDELQAIIPDGRFSHRTRFLAALAAYELKAYADGAKRLEALLAREGVNPFQEQATFLLAECHREMGQYEQAAAKHDEVAHKLRGPLADNALFRLGYIHFLQKKYSAARSDFSELRLMYPNSEYINEAGIYLGRALLESGDYTEAQAVFAKLADKEETRVEGTLWLGKTWLRQKQFAKALAILQPGMEQYINTPHAHEYTFSVANALMGLEDYAKAASIFLKATEGFPESELTPSARRLQAFCLHRAGAFGQSFDATRDFLQRWPEDPAAGDIAFLKAENLFFTNQDEQAVPAYKQFIPWEGETKYTSEAHFRIAQIAARNERWRETEQELTTLLENPPQDSFFRQLHFLNGLANLKLQNWDDAAQAFEHFLKVYPSIENSDTAYLHLADIHLHFDRKPQALEKLETLIRKHPDSAHLAQAHGKAGRIAYELRELPRARKHFETVVLAHGASPFFPQAEYYLGWIAVTEGKRDEAMKRFAHLAENYTEHALAPDARYQYATLLMEQSAWTQAEENLRFFLLNYGEDAKASQATFSLGVALARQGQFEQAGAVFNKFRKQFPESSLVPRSMYEEAWCARELNRPIEAAALYDTMLTSLPEADLANRGMLELAEIHFDAERNDEAIALLDRLLARNVTGDLRAQTLYRRGWCLLARDQKLAAAESFETLLQEFPNFKGAELAAYQAGEVRLERKEFRNAHSLFEKAVTIENDQELHAQALLRYGEAQTLIGHWEPAEKTFRQFLNTYPTTEYVRRARMWLGWSLENQSLYKEAIAQYRLTLEGGSRDNIAARSQFQIGECLYAQGDYDDAVKELIKVDANYQHEEWSARALLEIARVLEKQGQKGKAIERFEEVTRRFPNGNEAALAREILAEANL